ncbi:O-antigen ligase family protein [Thalassomonas sp. RHCl1]|uniref:O-antigen ligase family protein n=1 Tax=Thalassomonas sp. RHCl1 TaxID=2995320 RepID=UPI00248C9C75|nr:O-antigen ligase family protein [Thalassomonas sp. RHCl1]
MTENVTKLGNLFSLYKYALVLTVAICLFFIAPLTKLSLVPSFVDEAILFGLFLFTAYKSRTDKVVRYVFILYLTLFAFFVAMSVSALSSRGLTAVLLQVFIHLKYMLFFVFFWALFGPKYSLKFAYFILGVTVLFLVINVLTGSWFNTLLDTPINLRSGGARPIGIQADTGSLGTTFALLGCLFICGLKSVSRSFKVVLLIIASVFILVASTRTGLILLPLIVLWWLRDSFKSFVIAILLVICAALAMKSSNYMDEIVEITINNVESTIDDPVASSYIRGIMIFFSFELANDRFPLGTGAATYGTVMSDNSDVYAEIGLQNSRYFVDKEGIYDSNFASLLGEFGYFGVILYFVFFYKMIKAPIKNSALYCSEGEFRFVLFLLVLAHAITTPIFMNTYPAFILALVMVASYHHQSAAESKIEE